MNSPKDNRRREEHDEFSWIPVLEILLSAGGAEVSSAALAHVIPQFSEQLAELQAMGFPIAVRRAPLCDGRCRSYFRLDLKEAMLCLVRKGLFHLNEAQCCFNMLPESSLLVGSLNLPRRLATKIIEHPDPDDYLSWPECLKYEKVDDPGAL